MYVWERQRKSVEESWRTATLIQNFLTTSIPHSGPLLAFLLLLDPESLPSPPLVALSAADCDFKTVINRDRPANVSTRVYIISHRSCVPVTNPRDPFSAVNARELLTSTHRSSSGNRFVYTARTSSVRNPWLMPLSKVNIQQFCSFKLYSHLFVKNHSFSHS